MIRIGNGQQPKQEKPVSDFSHQRFQVALPLEWLYIGKCREKKMTKFAVPLVARLAVFPKYSAQIHHRLQTKAIYGIYGK